MKYVELGGYFLLFAIPVVLILLSLWFLGVWSYLHKMLRAERKADEVASRRNSMKGQSSVIYAVGAAVVAVVVLLLLIMGSGAQVDAGYVGVVSQWGSIDKGQQPLDPGFHLINPVGTHITSVSVQPQNHTFKEVAASSKELQNVYVDGGVNYHIDSNHAAELQIEGGLDAVVSKVFDPAFQDYMKEVVPQYNATDILANRAKIRDAVLSDLQQKAAPYGITVDDVFITNIHFDKNYTDAIEAAAVAQQKLAQAKIDAQTAVTQAQGQAQAAVAKAQGDAQANALINQSLTPGLIQYNEVQKWNGVLPQVDGGGNIISLPTLSK